MTRISAVVLLALSCLISTAVARLPAGRSRHAKLHRNSQSVNKRATWQGYRNVGYYPDWAIYDPKFFITDIPAQDFTHILYAFANVDSKGIVTLGDPWADIQYPYPGDNTNAAGNNLYGNLKQLLLLKKNHRNVKSLLSIGGATWSTNFANVNDPTFQGNFANSSTALLMDLGFDGIDVDYGIVQPSTKLGTTALLAKLRTTLDAAAVSIGATEGFLLSFAAPCGSYNYGNLDVPGMDASLDMWNLMAYDFSGSWTPEAALPASNLYFDPNPKNDVDASGDDCSRFYINQGVNSRKLNLGMPLYGTGFAGTSGMYTKWTSQGDGNYNTPGYYEDRNLLLSGETAQYHSDIGASWSSNSDGSHIISFDMPEVARDKANYVMNKNMGGMMYWSIEADWTRKQALRKKRSESSGMEKRNITESSYREAIKNLKMKTKEAAAAAAAGVNARDEIVQREEDTREIQHEDLEERGSSLDLTIGVSLVDLVKTVFTGTSNMDTTQNTISYPTSQYDNVRSN